MKKIVLSISILVNLIGCVSSENQIKEALNKNPQLIFDVIENNPEQFIEVVNSAAQKAQQQKYDQQLAKIKADQERELKEPKKPTLNTERLLDGTEEAPITIVEYADFQCPACAMAASSLQEFKAKYPGKFKFYYKHLPLDFHKMAYPAAQYFEAIRLQDKTKAKLFYDLVFKNQQQLKDESDLIKLAKIVKADSSQIQKDIKGGRVNATIEDDMKEFEKFGFTGTPVVLINGVALHGAQPLSELERIAKLTGGL